MILIAGYVVVTGIIVSSETVMAAQKEMNTIQSGILMTNIDISSSTWMNGTMTLTINNTGNMVISDMSDIDLYILEGTSMNRYTYPGYSRTLSPDTINPEFWDPDETLTLSISITPEPIWVQVTTPNGISASGYL